MADGRGTVWVLAEQGDERIHFVSMELIGKARELADELGTSLEAVFCGHEIRDNARSLISAGVDKVYLADAPLLATYQSEVYTDIIVDLVREHQPDILLLGSTFMGRELAPLLAARLKTGLSAHCIDLVINQDKILEQIIPAYGGMMTIVCPEKRPQMATVARGVFPEPRLDETREGEIIPIDVSEGRSQRVHTLEIVHEEQCGVSLESATAVVAGGAGAGNSTGWCEIVELADVLNAAIGSTRPAVDEGWTELETMIGQSGKMINPDLYIGIGLSGEQQHMVGITGAKVMVAINNDPKSPVFEQVDYGIIEDCREILPVLINKLMKFKGKT